MKISNRETNASEIVQQSDPIIGSLVKRKNRTLPSIKNQRSVTMFIPFMLGEKQPDDNYSCDWERCIYDFHDTLQEYHSIDVIVQIIQIL